MPLFPELCLQVQFLSHEFWEPRPQREQREWIIAAADRRRQEVDTALEEKVWTLWSLPRPRGTKALANDYLDLN
jgi:hypothetical protein